MAFGLNNRVVLIVAFGLFAGLLEASSNRTLNDCLQLLQKNETTTPDQVQDGHHVLRRSIDASFGDGHPFPNGSAHSNHSVSSLGMEGLEGGLGFDTQDILRMASQIPADTLNLIRLLAVPIVNTSLALPAHVLYRIGDLENSTFNSSHSWNPLTMLPGNATYFHGLNFHGAPSNHSFGNAIHSTSVGNFSTGWFSGINSSSLLPKQLDSGHMHRHLDNLRRFLAVSYNNTMDN